MLPGCPAPAVVRWIAAAKPGAISGAAMRWILMRVPLLDS
ncbi:lipid A export ATP-binding/permease protein MsbA [Sideroxyarcus emersonii]|uniref:Lipid A export ATP-binding/permease protein MsbA n=1 Tax=Sideroxyarcus emersonii TaxID=2764705 RepID=A0AAN1XBM3_9PROT|nr:lipid A export ATP-binding/permease protein MsbA [Sideroxyarcus emersonii]